MPRPDAERLARGALLQQGAQIVRLGGGLVVLTLIARRFTFTELGLYALLVSLVTYVQFLKASVMNAAIIGVAEAGDDDTQAGRVVSTGFAIYACVGLASGVLLLAVGLLALPVLNLPADLEDDARAGVAGLAAVTAVGWPAQIFDDLLRGRQRFAVVSAMEIAGMLLYMGGAVAMVLLEAPVPAIVVWTAAIPLLQGVLCLVALLATRSLVPFGRRHVERGEARRFGSASALLALGGAADLAVVSLDRAILSGFRSPAAVGRYEGPLQMQNSVRYLHGVLAAPAIPAATGYLAQDDRLRMRELYVRALRYILAATCPFAVVLIVQAGPIMAAWLGERFAGLGGAAGLYVSWWLLGANLGVVGAFLFAARRFRFTVAVSWAAAVVNLGLTFALTPSVGLYGPIAGALAGWTLQLALLLRPSLRIAGVGLGEVAREAWLPAYACAAVTAGALLALKAAVDLTTPSAAVATLVLAPLAYWSLFAAVFARPDELALARRVLQRRA